MRKKIYVESKSIYPRHGDGWLSPLILKFLIVVVASVISADVAYAQFEQVELSTRTPIWSFNPYKYMTNMTVTCQPQIEGVPVDTAYEIGAFCGNECRGNALVRWSITRNHFVVYLVVMGDWHDTIVFRLYDHRHQSEIISATPPSLLWLPDEMLGTAKNLYAINFVSTLLHETDKSTPQTKLFAGKWDGQIFKTKDDSCASVIDLTAVDGLPSERPATRNPNAIVCVPASSAQTLSDADNVAVSSGGAWTAKRIVIKDGYPYSSGRSITATNACFQRTYSANVTTTLCLPFDFVVTNGDLYNIKGVYGGALHLNKISDGKGTANMPYLFVPASTGELTINGDKNNIVVKAVDSTYTLNDDNGIASSYSAVCNYDMNHSVASDSNASYYGWADDNAGALSGSFVRCITGAYANAFRVYISGPASLTAKELAVLVDNDATAIRQLNGYNADASEMNVYSLSGALLMRSVTMQKALKELPKGIYVMGNNKIKIQK